MTPEQFQRAVYAIGWSKRHLAAILNVQDSAVRRWSSGDNPIPAHLADWLVRLSSVHDAHPLPDDWDNREPKETDMPKPKLCAICLRPYEGFGHNPLPIKSGRCCDTCNATVVIPARIEEAFRLTRAQAPKETSP